MRASLRASETWGMRSAAQWVYLVLHHISPPGCCRRRSLDREWHCSSTNVALPWVTLQYYRSTDLNGIFLWCCTIVWCITSVSPLTKLSLLSILASCLGLISSKKLKALLKFRDLTKYIHPWRPILIHCIWKWCCAKEEVRKSPVITFEHFEKIFPTAERRCHNNLWNLKIHAHQTKVLKGIVINFLIHVTVIEYYSRGKEYYY